MCYDQKERGRLSGPSSSKGLEAEEKTEVVFQTRRDADSLREEADFGKRRVGAQVDDVGDLTRGAAEDNRVLVGRDDVRAAPVGAFVRGRHDGVVACVADDALVESGTHRELLGQRGLYRRLYDLQWSGEIELA